MFGNDMVLTIGLPLMAGLNTRQFAGVLAHEFGHFAQGAGMRLTYVIRSINFWLLRVVYQRDQADEWLANAAASTDFRFSWVLYLAMFFVWISRKILWVLMVIGNLVGSYLLRQMEFDADRYETRLAGSKAFRDTARQLNVQGAATQLAFRDLGEFYREGRLGDDLPRLILAKVSQLPKEAQQSIDTAIQETATGWLDTHPADHDRIANAEREQTEGIFHVERPATVLLSNFSAQAKATTWEFYLEQFGKNLERERLRPVSEMLEKQKKQDASQASLDRYFKGQWNASLPLRLSTDSLSPPEEPRETLRQLKVVRKEMLQLVASTQSSFQTLQSESDELAIAEQLRHCVRAGLKIKPDENQRGEVTEEKFKNRVENAQRKIDKARDSLAEYQDLASRRVHLGLQLLNVPQVAERIPKAGMWKRNCKVILPCLRAIGDSMDFVVTCARLHGASRVFFDQLSSKNDDSLIFAIEGIGDKLTPIAKRLHTTWSRMPYPYDHAKKNLSLSGYLIPTVPIQGDLGSVFSASEQIVDGTFPLYLRLLGDLITCAEAVEAAVGLPEKPK